MHLSIAPKGCLARGLTTAWLCKLPWATTNVAIVDAYGLPPDALAMGAAEKLLACHVATACLRLQAWARTNRILGHALRLALDAFALVTTQELLALEATAA
jgi:hypothetical protein